jgi:hypothetical protein
MAYQPVSLRLSHGVNASFWWVKSLDKCKGVRVEMDKAHTQGG